MAAPTWAPRVENENKLAQLPVTVFAARGKPGAQPVAANDGIGRAGDLDGHCFPLLSRPHCRPGISHLQLRCREHGFGAESLRSLGPWRRGEALRRPVTSGNPAPEKQKAAGLDVQPSLPELLGHRCGEEPGQDRTGPWQNGALSSRLPPTSWIKEKVTGPFETKGCLLSGQERQVWADRCLLISCTFQNPWCPQDSRVVTLSIPLPAAAPPSHPQKAVIKTFQDPGLSPPIGICLPPSLG